MKRMIPFILILIVFLTGCTSQEAPTTAPTTETTVCTTIPATAEPTTAPTTLPTEPAHSAFYIPGLEVEDVILYFSEVCLDAEFTNSGDPSRLQKWTHPIFYAIHGEPTDEDSATLQHFTDWLNTVEGFPGIYRADDPEYANLRIYFCTAEEMRTRMGDNFVGMDGGVTFWYLEDNIYDAIICYRTDLDQYLRNSVILEEIYNGLGPIQDTSLRPDSIIYTDFSQPQALTEIDELILRLLYHPQLQCGMDAAACDAVIRQLYY